MTQENDALFAGQMDFFNSRSASRVEVALVIHGAFHAIVSCEVARVSCKNYRTPRADFIPVANQGNRYGDSTCDARRNENAGAHTSAIPIVTVPADSPQA